MRRMIQCYEDFVRELLSAGFTSAGSGEKWYALSAQYGEKIRWHTGDPDTDPWEWRMRILEERDDIAYAKVFFRKGGLISKEWYPYFLAARRDGLAFEDAYLDGVISYEEKRIYEVIRTEGRVPVHVLKRLGGFSGADSARFDRALISLQMRLFITICGRRYKNDAQTGWSSTVFCTTEEFFGSEVFNGAGEMDRQEAVEVISARIYQDSPEADRKKVQRFIMG
jgi:hypothetical protein